MAMLDYSEVLPRKVILHDGEPYEVLEAHVFRKQMRKPVNATKLKNLISGRVIEISFQQSDKVEEADMGIREVKYLYTHRGEYWFCDPKNPSDRFKLPAEQVEHDIRWVKVNSVVEARTFNGEIIALKIPIKVELQVTEAAPAVRGDTSGRATKLVTLETGAKIAVPLFINEGDIVRINTEDGTYVERAEKA
jgi:elongation factor P